MLQNYLKIGLRNLLKTKLFSSINIIGLTIGLTTSLLMMAWVWDEISYDQFHEKGDRICSVLVNMESSGQINTWTNTPYPLVDLLKTSYPEIEAASMRGYTSDLFYDGKSNFRERGYNVDPDFFDIFSFPFLHGDPATAFKDPQSIVVSQELAEKLVGIGQVKNALGLQVKLNGKTDFQITGIFKDIPNNSTLHFNYAIDFKQRLIDQPWEKEWDNFNNNMFLLVKEGNTIAQVSEKIKKTIIDNRDDSEGNEFLYLQPFEDTYLYSNFENGIPVGGRIDYVKILFAAALFLLFIACINFTNLMTARSSKRAKEIGIRKVVGASRFSLIRQFMGEAFLATLVALGLAIGLSEILLPQFLLITGKEVSFNYSSPLFWLGMSAVFLVTVFLSGAYPAFFLSSMNINRILKKQPNLQMSSGIFRKVLVVSQFVLSTVLIIGAMVVTQQINFIQNKNLGLDRENLIYMDLQENMHDQNEAFRNELSQQAGIKEFVQINQNPLWVGNNTNSFGWEGQSEDDDLFISFINTDPNFLDMMDIDLIAGRDFSTDMNTDSSNFIINETLAKIMDLEDPVGTRAAIWGQEGTIIGVTKDFHFRPLHHEISPVVIRNDPKETYRVFVRTEAGQTEEAIASLEKINEQFAPSYPFHFTFLDERYEEFYRSEMTTAKLARIFALIAIFISCLGLFGLTAFIAEQKTKEIGIRKVLGASVANIVTLLSIDFLKLIVVALLIASPIAYYLMQGWLSNYAYHIDLNWQSILIAGVVALLIALLTISVQSFKAAISNPVESLKNE